MVQIPWLEKGDSFPAPSQALEYPNGLLAAGADLKPDTLLSAYRQGIFPWFQAGDPILWWSPSPRMVLFPQHFHCSRSLRKTLNRKIFSIKTDTAFAEVIEQCSLPRRDADGTWITTEMKQAYLQLHQMGYAHSIEAWYEGELVGGLYGIKLGDIFFGESMFAHMTNASKVAFATLIEWLAQSDCKLIDCQVTSSHLQSLGAIEVSRDRFISLLERYIGPNLAGEHWRLHEHEVDGGH